MPATDSVAGLQAELRVLGGLEKLVVLAERTVDLWTPANIGNSTPANTARLQLMMRCLRVFGVAIRECTDNQVSLGRHHDSSMHARPRLCRPPRRALCLRIVCPSRGFHNAADHQLWFLNLILPTPFLPIYGSRTILVPIPVDLHDSPMHDPPGHVDRVISRRTWSASLSPG